MSVPTIDDDGGNEYEDYKALAKETARVCVDLMREAYDATPDCRCQEDRPSFDEWLNEQL